MTLWLNLLAFRRRSWDPFTALNSIRPTNWHWTLCHSHLHYLLLWMNLWMCSRCLSGSPALNENSLRTSASTSFFKWFTNICLTALNACASGCPNNLLKLLRCLYHSLGGWLFPQVVQMLCLRDAGPRLHLPLDSCYVTVGLNCQWRLSSFRVFTDVKGCLWGVVLNLGHAGFCG